VNDADEPQSETSTIYVTSLQVRAAKVAIKANSILGEPSPPGLIKIAEARPAPRDRDPRPQ
jgi:hypothetical protein